MRAWATMHILGFLRFGDMFQHGLPSVEPVCSFYNYGIGIQHDDYPSLVSCGGRDRAAVECIWAPCGGQRYKPFERCDRQVAVRATSTVCCEAAVVGSRQSPRRDWRHFWLPWSAPPATLGNPGPACFPDRCYHPGRRTVHHRAQGRNRRAGCFRASGTGPSRRHWPGRFRSHGFDPVVASISVCLCT